MIAFIKKMVLRLSLVTVVIISLSGCQRTFDDYMLESKKAIAENNQTEAIMSLKNAIQSNPNNSDARFLLAETYFEVGAFLFAAKEYERAVELGLPCSDVMPKYTLAQFRQFKLENVLDMSPIDCDDQARHTDSLLYAYLAAKQLGLENQAQRIQQNAVEKYPNSVFTKLISVYALIAEEEYSTANERIRSLIPNSQSEVYFANAWLLSFSDQHQAVIDSLNEYTLKERHDLRANILFARTYMLTAQLDKALTETDKVLQFFPNNIESNVLKSMALFRKREFAKAVKFAEKAIDLGTNNPQARITAGLAEFSRGNIERSYQHFLTIKESIKNNDPLLQLIANLEYQLGYHENPDEINLQDGSSSLTEQYLISLFKSGDTKILEEINSNARNPNAATILILAANYVENENFEAASNLIAKYLEANIDSPHGYNLMALMEIKRGNADAAKFAIQKALLISPYNVFSRLLMASEDISKGKYNDALMHVNKVLVQHPLNIKALDLSLRLHTELKTPNKGLTQLKNTALANQDNKKLQKLYIQWLLRLNLIEDALKYSLAAVHKDEIGNKEYFWQVIFDIYLVKKNVLAAESIVNQWQQHMPQSPSPLLRKANLYYAMQRPQLAMDVLNQGIQAFPNEHAFKVIKARFLLAAQDYQKASDTLLGVPINSSNAYQINLMQSQILTKQNKGGAALELLEAQYEITPNEEVAKLIFGNLLARGKTEKALKFIKQHIEIHDNTTASKTLLAGVLMDSSPLEAREIYKDIASEGTTDPIVLNNLAWLYFQARDLNLALKYAEKAHEIAPASFQVLDTLAQIKIAKGDFQQALVYVDQGLSLDPGSSELKSLRKRILAAQ